MALNARRTTIIVISRTHLPKLGTSLNTNPRPQALVPTVHSVSGFDSSGGCTSVELPSGAVREGAANRGAESVRKTIGYQAVQSSARGRARGPAWRGHRKVESHHQTVGQVCLGPKRHPKSWGNAGFAIWLFSPCLALRRHPPSLRPTRLCLPFARDQPRDLGQWIKDPSEDTAQVRGQVLCLHPSCFLQLDAPPLDCL